ncbi:MAG TPA: hypothetical protein VGR29_09240 [Thermomicrobiales bacterium]|nr:hypothetical protein [Thermomicrobiales bacterium]
MIVEFLRQEFASTDRYMEKISACLDAERVSPGIILNADISNPNENAQRRRVFARYRGYGTGSPSYLTGFPDHGVSGQWATLTPQEILDVRHIRYCYWTALSAGTRSPVIAARRIRQGIEVYGVSNQRFLQLASLVAQGVAMPPLILVSVPVPIAFVVLEGHTRLTAYALAADHLAPETRVMIGIAPAITRWDEY